MITFKKIARSRWVVLGVVLGLAVYYFLIFRPLSKGAETLDKPLAEIWQELVDFSKESSSIRDLDLDRIKKTRESLRASMTATEKVREKISARVELEAEIRAKMDEPFYLIDFQNERQKRIEQLIAQSKTQQVTLDAAALSGFPEYNAETRDPSLLWAQLAMVHHVLTVAINSKVGQVKNVSLLAMQTEAGANADAIWQEIQLRIELIAPMPCAANFLSAMPLRAEELKDAGLAESFPGKPSFFLNRLLLRKQTPEKADEVSLDVVVSSFVPGRDEKLNRSQEKGVAQ